jgi:hypothetical protein
LCAAHDVLELADVARPAVHAQHRQRGVADPRRRRAVGRVAQQQRQRERGNVRRPLAQRDQAHREHVEAVVQVRAEPPCFDLERQVAVGRGDDPHVDLTGRSRRPRTLALLQRAQQLGLQRERHLADLVEQQRAAVGRAKKPSLARRAGERALLVAEQLALEQRLGDRRAVDRDERLVACRLRSWMKRLSTSLPVPVGPLTSTGMSFRASRSATASTDSVSGSAATGSLRPASNAMSAAKVPSEVRIGDRPAARGWPVRLRPGRSPRDTLTVAARSASSRSLSSPIVRLPTAETATKRCLPAFGQRRMIFFEREATLRPATPP